MRFWLRHEEMALEEMVQRLNAVSKRTGRRSRRPEPVVELDIVRRVSGDAPGFSVAGCVSFSKQR